MASEVGLSGAPKFKDLHATDIKLMKVKLLKYLKDLSNQRTFLLKMPMSEDADGAVAVADAVVTITANGFPVLPDIEFSTKTQEYLANMMRQYLSRHYSMFII